MSISFKYDLTYDGPAFPVIEVVISSESDQQSSNVTALIDTGADATIIPLHILESIKARRINTQFVRTVEGTRYSAGLHAVKITIGPYTFFGIDAIGNEHTDEIILGRDVLNQLAMNLNGITKTTSIET